MADDSHVFFLSNRAIVKNPDCTKFQLDLTNSSWDLHLDTPHMYDHAQNILRIFSLTWLQMFMQIHATNHEYHCLWHELGWRGRPVGLWHESSTSPSVKPPPMFDRLVPADTQVIAPLPPKKKIFGEAPAWACPGGHWSGLALSCSAGFVHSGPTCTETCLLHP